MFRSRRRTAARSWAFTCVDRHAHCELRPPSSLNRAVIASSLIA